MTEEQLKDVNKTLDCLGVENVQNIILIKHGATNGDIIKAIFKCMVIAIANGKVYVEKIYFPFDEDWWNAPYERGSENE